MLTSEKVLATATPNAAPVVPGSYIWTASDPSLVDLFPQGDGAQCWVVGKDLPGTVVITAQALPAPDLPPIFGANSLDLTVLFSTELVITFGTPEPR